MRRGRAAVVEESLPVTPVSELYRLPSGPVDLTDHDTGDLRAFDGDKSEGKAALKSLGPELADLQERLYAGGTAGDRRRVLVVLQGMDTSGKGGVIRRAVGLVDPQGVRIVSFKRPTPEELEHDFLWRIERQVPQPGYVGVFDRSHYEDVLIGRVRQLAPAEEIERRYDAINDFEQRLADDGVVLLKCMLHVGPEKQKGRLAARLEDPTKHWKYKPGDVDERKLWPSYQAAYELALERTNTDHAPWHVIPADRKWYRNLVVARLLLESLQAMELSWPDADFDLEVEKARVAQC